MTETTINQVIVGDSYRAWRERMTLSHKEAAEALGFCRRTSINYQNGSTKTLPGAITKLCEMLERDKILGI